MSSFFRHCGKKNFKVASEPIEAASVIASNKVIRYNKRMDAFKTAQALEPSADREKVEGFILFVGTGPDIIEAGPDREAAVEKAVKILEEKDTVVFLSKLQSKFGEVFVTKDQLMFRRI